MKFAIAPVAYWDSIGFDTTVWRKSLDGTKAICHLDYAEKLGLNLYENSQVKIYDIDDPNLDTELSATEWVVEGTNGDLDIYSFLVKLGQFETKLNNAVTAKIVATETDVRKDIVKTDTKLEGYITTNDKDKLSLTTQLQQTEQELSSQLAHKVGGGLLATMADLDQDVKTAMTGGSVAVVGDNSVIESNIVNRQVKARKISKYAVNQDHLDKTLFNDYDEIGYVARMQALDDAYSYLLFKFPTGESFTTDTIKNYRIKFRLKNFSQYSLTVRVGRASVKASSLLDETVLQSPSTIHQAQHSKDAIVSYDVPLTGYVLNSTYSVPIGYIAVGNNTMGINYLKHFQVCDLVFESEDGLRTYPVERYEVFNNGRHTDDTSFYYLDSLDKRLSTKTYVNTKINEVKSELVVDTYFSTKKWGFVGDSQTEGWDDTGKAVSIPYPNTVAQLLGLKSYANYGLAGSTIARSTKTPIVDRLTALATDLDIISVFAGTNDWGHGSTTVQRPLGTIDSTDVATFYGALNYICDYLITNYTTKLIFLGTPLHREGENTPNSHGLKLIDYVNAIRVIGQKYSIPVLDLYNTGNLYPDNATHKAQLIKDGIHPTQWYYTNVLARKFASFAKTII